MEVDKQPRNSVVKGNAAWLSERGQDPKMPRYFLVWNV